MDIGELRSKRFFIPSKWLDLVGCISDTIGPTLSESRRNRLQEKVGKRSTQVLTVLEEMYHPHNISAVLRTTEAFGFCTVLSVLKEPVGQYRPKDSVERGTSQWLIVKRAHDSQLVCHALHEQGYAICLVTSPDFAITKDYCHKYIPHFSADQIGSIEFSQTLGTRPIALIFGNEKWGIEPFWFSKADFVMHIPMRGFVESLNVSVCAGILLHSLGRYFNKAEHLLNDFEQRVMLDYWIARSSAIATQMMRKKNIDALNYFDFVKAGYFIRDFNSNVFQSP